MPIFIPSVKPVKLTSARNTKYRFGQEWFESKYLILVRKFWSTLEGRQGGENNTWEMYESELMPQLISI